MIRMKTLLLAGVMATAGLAGTAHALTYTQQIQFGGGLTDYNRAPGTSNIGPAGDSLYFFDSQGATLNSITFTTNYGFSSNITLTNTSTSSGSSGSVRTESAAQLSSSDARIEGALNRNVNTISGAIIGSSQIAPVMYDISGTNNLYNLSTAGQPGDRMTVTSTGSGGPVSRTTTNAADLAAFTNFGGGLFQVLFSTLTGTSLTQTSGNTLASQSTTANAGLSITYDYTVNPTPPPTGVPEPASLALLGMGLLGLGLVRRRG